MPSFAEILSGGDLRSIGAGNDVAAQIQQQADFDALFDCLFLADRRVVMRAADALEKVSRKHPDYLIPHRAALLQLSREAVDKELLWHLAQLLPRLEWDENDVDICRQLLLHWAAGKEHSRIVRVNALQGLFDLAKAHPGLRPELELLLDAIEKEGIPSLVARVRLLRGTR